MTVLQRWAKRLAILVAVVLCTVFAVRAVQSELGPPLQPWHLYVGDEMSPAEIDAADWEAWTKHEDALLADMRATLAGKIEPEDRIPASRYTQGGPIDPFTFPQDWNRSFIIEPEGRPRGAVVLLHGLTDSPYSMRHVAGVYRDAGFVAVVPRIPGHGTTPGGLTDATAADWMAAVRLAVREARRRAGPDVPLHVVGYSNGGALAMTYTLDALETPALARPDKVILFSPMVGVTSLARFAGLAGLPAILPRFAKAAWLDIVPEYNPFKYNSFPVNAARQSYLVSSALQERLLARARDARLGELPPILTFQSVMDSTVSTPAIVRALYERLPPNGSELVLFDVNRAARVAPLIRASAGAKAETLLPPAPRNFRSVLVTNASADTSDVVARIVEAGGTQEQVVPLSATYPADVYSLSHIALPFPEDDALYGLRPTAAESFGVRLGSVEARGERGVLVVGLDTLLRISANPFYPLVAERIRMAIGPQAPRP
jgi:alpha-beta hydrolase superfamily lysophospholipase